MRILTLSLMAGMASLSFAVTLPYSTGFETSQGWAAAGATLTSLNVGGWSGQSNWKTSTAQAFSGTQSVMYSYTGVTGTLPNSVFQSPTYDAPGNVEVAASMKFYMATSVNGSTNTANTLVGGYAGRLLNNFGQNFRVGITGDGRVVTQKAGSFSWASLGTLSGAHKDQWLTLELSVNANNGQAGASTFTVKNAGGATLFTNTSNLLTTGTISTSGVNYLGVLGTSDGTSGLAAQFGLMYYDDFSVQAVPEPATMTVLGLLAAAGLRRRNRR